MALGTLLGAAASAGVSALASKFLGGNSSGAPIAALQNTPSLVSKKQVDAALTGLKTGNFTGFNAGGLSSTLNNGTVGVTASADRLGAIGKLAQLFPQFGDKLAELRGRVDPTTGALKSAALGELDNARGRAIGNLRDNLQKRRVLGSSFAQDSLANAEAEFAQQRAMASAEIDAQGIQLTQQLLGQELEVRQGEFNTWLSEWNLEGGLAAELSSQYQSEMNKNAQVLATVVGSMASNSQSTSGANLRTAAELLAKSDAGDGALARELTKPLSDAFGNQVTSLFSPKKTA